MIKGVDIEIAPLDEEHVLADCMLVAEARVLLQRARRVRIFPPLQEQSGESGGACDLAMP